MQTIRGWVFNVLFYGLTGIASVLCMPVLILPKRVVMATAKTWARCSLALARIICGIQLDIKGQQHLLPPPAIFACKHQSALETIALTMLLDNFCFILKRELLYIPIFGLYLRRINSIAIDRKSGASAIRQMVKETRKKLAQSCSVVIFAEGTRVSPDQEDAPYHPGIAALYSQLDAPVVPVALNTGLCWGRKAMLKKAGIATIEFLAPIPAQLERKTFMAALKKRIEQRSAELRDAERRRLQNPVMFRCECHH